MLGQIFTAFTPKFPKIKIVGICSSLVLLVAWLTLAPTSYAQTIPQDGTVDLTFNLGMNGQGTILASDIQSDSKILIGGLFTAYNGTTVNSIARLNPNGTLDSSFNPNFEAKLVRNIKFQEDGKILLAGSININGIWKGTVARLNSDGSLDTTFSLNLSTDATIYTLKILGNGQILAAGEFSAYSGITTSRVVRLNSDGSVDSTFKSNLPPTGIVYDLDVQNDGKILVGGNGMNDYANGDNSSAARVVRRLNPNGSLDNTFTPGTVKTDQFAWNIATINIYALKVLNDGKILAAGSFNNFNDSNYAAIVRLNSDGSVDTTFKKVFSGSDNISAFLIQPDNKIIVASGYYTNLLSRLNPDGSFDSTFNNANNTPLNYYWVDELHTQADGKIIVVGGFPNYNKTNHALIVRLDANGLVDETFNPSGPNTTVNDIKIQPDNKILIGGDFTSYGTTTIKGAARLNVDGSLDASFNSGAGANKPVQKIALQSDNKILLGGYFTEYNNTPINYLARLNQDGTLDSSFNANLVPYSNNSPTSGLYALALQPDNKIVVGGKFLTPSGSYANGLARLNPDSSLDTAFSATTPVSGTIRAIAIQTDGKILVAGNFSLNNQANIQLARLNSDGSLDTAFNLGLLEGNAGSPVILALDITTNGQIVVGGQFSRYNGSNRSNLARLNADGTLDTTFVSSLAQNPNEAYILAVKVQANNKIIATGNFTYTSPLFSKNIVRFNLDGSLDTSFNTVTGILDATVGGSGQALALQNDNKIIVGGDFKEVNSYKFNNIVRLTNRQTSNLTLTSSSNPTDVSKSVTFTVTLSPITATGIVTFTFGGSANFTATSSIDNGVATYVTNGLPVGLVPVRAIYSGDSKLQAFSSLVYTQTINKIATFLNVNSTPNPSNVGQTVTFTASISPTNVSGSLTFTIGTNNISTSLNNGVATYVTNTLPLGDYLVTATYGGSSVYSSSLSTNIYSHTVIKNSSSLTVTSTPNPAISGQTVTFTAQLAPSTATGMVTFDFGSNIPTTTVEIINGQAVYITSQLPTGIYSVTATYNGDSSYYPASTPVYTQVINSKIATELTLSSSPNPSTFGQTVTFTAQLSPTTTTGTVTFTVGTYNISAPLNNGLATYITNTLPVGNYLVTATYGGSPVYSSSVSNGQYTHTVIAACNPLVVTNFTDDGAATLCGTFSYALDKASIGDTVSFALTQSNLLTFTGSLTPTVKLGVAINGGNLGIVLNGNGVVGDGLRLSGNNTLTNLVIQHFAGRELVANGSGNRLYKVRLEN